MSDRITFRDDASDRIAFAGTVEAEGRRIRGEVILAGARTWRNGEWLEVDPAAVVRADASAAFASWEHDDDKILADIPTGSLRLTRTETGFVYETDEVPNTTYANDALELLRRRLVGGTSFEIEGLRSQFSTDPDTGERTRRITSIQTFRQVGPVRDPAFAGSYTAAFSKETDMPAPTADPTPEPAPSPAPEPAPEPVKPKLRARFTSDETLYDTSVAFAKKLDTKKLSEAIEGFWAEADGDPDDIAMERIQAFEDVLADRQETDDAVANRRRTLEFQRKMRRGELPKPPTDAGLTESDEYAQAFNRYLRGDARALEGFREAFAQGEGSPSGGGYAVGTSMLRKFIERRKRFGGLANSAEVIVTADGTPLPWTSLDDTANAGEIVAEHNAGTNGVDLTFGTGQLGAYRYQALGASNEPLRVSVELLQDNAFDIEGKVAGWLARRIARAQAAHWCRGTGSSQPLGIDYDGVIDLDLASGNAVTYAKLVALTHKVDPEYREGGNCKWLFNDTTLGVIETVVDTNGRPILKRGDDGADTAASAGRLLGYPIVVDQAMPDIANGDDDPLDGFAIFGDLEEAYVIRRVKGFTLVVDPYSRAKYGEVEYTGWERADGTVQNRNAFAILGGYDAP